MDNNKIIEMRDYISHRLYGKTIDQAIELVDLSQQDQLIAEDVAQRCLLKRQDEWVIAREECREILDSELNKDEPAE